MIFSIYDTKSREVCEVASTDGVVHMYCCGPTVYRDAHVGNLRTFLLSDLIARTLELTGLKVNLIQNITDVGHMAENLEGEDKVLEQAKSESTSAFAIARKYEERFHTDLNRLNIKPAQSYPRASETMDLIISSISNLIEKNAAYVGTDGTVYFDAKSLPTYGAISGNKLDALKPGYRHEHTEDGGKRFHADWALWKTAGNRTEMIWDSPWGPGFPGWHIECTAMSLKYLNQRIDLHVGGIDLRFPHHENERAQSNSIIGKEAVDLWVHGEHLLFEGRKMSKSAGNVVLLEDLITRGLDPLSLRFVLLENRYRSQMDLTWASLEAAHTTLRRLRESMALWGSRNEELMDPEIYNALTQDLDTPRAMQRIRAVEKDKELSPENKRAIFIYADRVLGLDLSREIEVAPLPLALQELLDARAQARQEKNWEQSDALREKLESSGLIIKDKPGGQDWSWA
jgi:cysteinyl-tRNA synthetase